MFVVKLVIFFVRIYNYKSIGIGQCSRTAPDKGATKGNVLLHLFQQYCFSSSNKVFVTETLDSE